MSFRNLDVLLSFKANLEKTRTLDLSRDGQRNKICKLSEKFLVSFAHLELINLSHNNFQRLPEGLCRLRNCFINISNNPLHTIDEKLVEKCVKNGSVFIGSYSRKMQSCLNKYQKII